MILEARPLNVYFQYPVLMGNDGQHLTPPAFTPSIWQVMDLEDTPYYPQPSPP